MNRETTEPKPLEQPPDTKLGRLGVAIGPTGPAGFAAATAGIATFLIICGHVCPLYALGTAALCVAPAWLNKTLCDRSPDEAYGKTGGTGAAAT